MIHQTKEGIWVITGDSHHTGWITQSGKLAHDEATLPAIRKYIPQGGVVVDGGAHVGTHTWFYLDCVGPEGKVISFEPNPPAYRCLVRNCPDAVTYQLALGMDRGVFQMAHDNNYGGAYLTEFGAVRGSAVFTVPLDDLGLQRLDFGKFDLEGSEIHALAGAKSTIERCRPVMLLESNVGALARQGFTPDDLYRAVEDLGYNYQFLFPEHHKQMPQTDIICFPK